MYAKDNPNLKGGMRRKFNEPTNRTVYYLKGGWRACFPAIYRRTGFAAQI